MGTAAGLVCWWPEAHRQALARKASSKTNSVVVTARALSGRDAAALGSLGSGGGGEDGSNMRKNKRGSPARKSRIHRSRRRD